MPVLTRALNFFRRKQDTPIINDGRGNLPTVTIRGGFGYLPGARWTDHGYPGLAKTGYQSNSDVYACVSLIATTAKQVKFDQTVGEDLLRLLRAAGGRSFIESWISYILLSGNAWIEVGRNAAGVPVVLYLIQPDRVSAKTNINTPGTEDNRRPQVNMWIVRNAKGMQYPVLPQDMVHSRLFHPLDEIFGMAPLEAAMLQVDAQNEGATLMKRMLQGGFAPGWIEAAEDSEWSDTQVAQLRERLRRSRESGEALWLQNAKWHEMGFPPVDSGVSEQQVLSKRDIASVFHVPPQLIGDTQSQTYCIMGDVRVSTVDGMIPISDLSAGSLLYSLNLQSGKMEVNRILRHTHTGRKPILKIRTNGRELRCSENHPLLIRCERWVPAPMTGKRHSPEKRQYFEYIRADQVKVGDVIVSAYQYPNSIQPTCPIPDINEDTMEFLGAMLGDGFVNGYEKKALISVAGIAGPVREFYRAYADGELRERCGGATFKISDEEREFRISSRAVQAFIITAGVTGRATTKRIPSWVFSQPRELRLAFLTGLFDTDGHVTKKGHIAFGVANPLLCQDVRDLAITVGLAVSNIEYYEREVRLPTGNLGLNRIWRFLCTVPALNGEIRSRNPEDQRRLTLGAQRPTKGRLRATGAKHCLAVPENCEYRAINSIEPADSEDVFDIEVEENHNFFAEHVCVHNSNYYSARQALYMEAVWPLLTQFRDDLNRTVGRDLKSEMEFDKDSFDAIAAARTEAADRVHKLWTAGLITQNEGRRDLEYDTVAGGDVFYAPANFLPLGGEVAPEAEGS